MRSSLGYHTFTIFLRLTDAEAISLYEDFRKNKDIRVRPLKKDGKEPTGYPKVYIAEYTSKYKGITWYVRFNDEMSKFMGMSSNHLSSYYLQEPRPYSVRAKINPKVLAGIKDYLTAANEDCLDDAEAQFNIEAAKISPVLGKFQHYSINRIDYCLNFDSVELRMGCSAKQMMTLIKQGNIPRYFKEEKIYSKKSHRKESYKNDFRIKNDSVTVSCYRKYAQLLANFPTCPDLEVSNNLMRFEVKYNYTKVNYISRIIKGEMRKKLTPDELWDDFLHDTVNPVKEMLTNNVCRNVISKYFHKVVRKGDYFTLKGARWMIQAHNFRQDKEDRLLQALKLVNDSRGIAKAKAKLSGDDLKDFKRSLKDLDDIFVNPVTIPRRWDVGHISNPLRAYYDCFYEERVVSKKEYLFGRLLAEYSAG